jgi:hypothetical protein
MTGAVRTSLAVTGPTAWPRMPGVRFGRCQTVSFDGCKTIKVPDTPRNRGWLGKMNAALGETGYPVIALMTLVETGTRALLGAVFGSTADGEITWAGKLVHLLDESMLVLMDRGFDAGKFLAQVAAAKAQFLVRLNANRRPPVLRHLPDGSFLSLIGEVKVRIIEASVTVTCHDGTRNGGSYRLATTLLDHRAYPAGALLRLYHERWQHEITYLALRHTLLAGRVLRSHDPEGLKQEMWALLAVYRALRIAITDAIATVPGTDPDRASYQIAVTPPRPWLPAPATSSPARPTQPEPSAAPSWPACTRRAAPASAPAGSNPRCPAGTSTRPADPAPACESPRSPPRSTATTRAQRHAASSA